MDRLADFAELLKNAGQLSDAVLLLSEASLKQIAHELKIFGLQCSKVNFGFDNSG